MVSGCTFAVGGAVDTAHPPVKVLLADGLKQGLVCPMEQVLLIHRSPAALLHHLLFLPDITESKRHVNGAAFTWSLADGELGMDRMENLYHKLRLYVPFEMQIPSKT